MCVYVHVHAHVKKERKIQDIRKQNKTKNKGHKELCWLAQCTLSVYSRTLDKETQTPS